MKACGSSKPKPIGLRHRRLKVASAHAQAPRTVLLTEALAGGILVLLMPRLLNYVVAIYLILVGFIGLNGLITSSADELAPTPGVGCA